MCGDERVQSIFFSYTELDLLKEGSSGRTSYSMTLNFKTDKKTYTLKDLPCKDKVILDTLDHNVVTVAENASNPATPTFTAHKPGTTTCKVSIDGQPGVTGTLKLHVLNLDVLNSDATVMIDGKFPHLLKDPLTVKGHPQGFDFYDESFQFFTSLSAPNINNSSNKTNIVNGKSGDVTYTITNLDNLIYFNDGKKNSNTMTFYNAGHGQNLSVEHTKDQDYVWFANFNSIYCSKKDDKNMSCSGSVYHSQTISRVPWQEGVSYYPNQVPENYYYKGNVDDKGKQTEYHFFLEPALDVKNNKFAFRSKMCPLEAFINEPGEYSKCTAGNVENYKNAETLRIYNLSSVKNIKAEMVTFPREITYLDSTGSLNTGEVTALVKNLSSLKPIHEFSKHTIPIQGVEIENGLVYTVARVPYLLETPDGEHPYITTIPIFVYDYNGTSLGGPNALKDKTINKNRNPNNENEVVDEFVYYVGAIKGDKATDVWVDYSNNSSCGKNDCHEKNNKNYCKCTGYFMDNDKFDTMFKFTEIDENGEYIMQPKGFYEPEGIRVSDGKLYIHVMALYARKNVKDNKVTEVRRQATLMYDLTKE